MSSVVKKEIQKTFDFIDSPRLLIRASAGTGKTFRLSSRYLALLRHSGPEKILSSTFTRKAAGEILERILLRLARASTTPKALRELATSLSVTNLTRNECLGMLAQLTQQLHRVRISTLDAFFAQLAGSHALELGFPSGWRILDPVEVTDLRAQALEQMLLEGDQQELVQLMHLLDKGDSSRSVSGLMRQTIDDLYSVFVDSEQAAWDRFPDHQFLDAAHREELLELLAQVQVDQKRTQAAIMNDSCAIREERWDDFLSKGLLPKIRSKDPTYYSKPIPPEVCRLYLQLSEHCLAVASASWKQQTLAAWRLLNDFQRIFDRLKQSAGGLEFGDVTRRLAQALGGGRIGQGALPVDSEFRMDGAIEHLLLDEFQDTSRAQWEVIRGFAEEACRHSNRSFFCVGDTKQAIYGWRGGEAAIFDTIETQLENLKTEPLNLSYRSSPIVIDAVNQVMQGIRQHDNLEDHAELLHQWCRNFPKHETTRKELTGYVCLRTGPDVPESEHGPATSQQQKDEQWKFAAAYTADLVRKSPHSTVGVLTRGNVAVGRMIYELNRLGIEASEEGGNPLTDAAGVQLILSLMQLADHPGDSIAAYHVFNSPLGAALQFPHFANGARVTEFAHQLRAKLVHEGYGALVHSLALQLAGSCDRREYRRLIQLAGLADRYDTLFSSLRPGDFVQYVKSQRCEEPSGSLVRVMNIHQSKGLEFDIVVLPELATPLILPPRYVTRTETAGGAPNLVALSRSEDHFASLGGELLAARTQTRDRTLQEALCVLYVALTRAARSLHMLIPPKVSKNHPKSFAGLLYAALAPQVPLKPNEILWETGDPNWSEAEEVPRQSASSPKKLSGEAPPLTFADSASRRHCPRTSPSQQKRDVEIEFPVSIHSDGLRGTERGILFHQWFELVEWVDTTPIDFDAMKRVSRTLQIPDAEAASQLAHFNACLQQPAISSLLSLKDRSGRNYEVAKWSKCSADSLTLKIQREMPFLYRLSDGSLMQGCMDRLVVYLSGETPVAADLIDFKTDNASTPEAAAILADYYRGQMEAYREAASRLLKIDPSRISASLAFVMNDRVEAVLH